jgi:hypothetical protein
VRHVQVRCLGPEIDPAPDTAVTTRVSAISVKHLMESDDQSHDSVQRQGLELTFPETSNGHNARQDGCAEGARPREVPRESCAPRPGAKAAHEDDKAQGVCDGSHTHLSLEEAFDALTTTNAWRLCCPCSRPCLPSRFRVPSTK